jgi:hypothetical protein
MPLSCFTGKKKEENVYLNLDNSEDFNTMRSMLKVQDLQYAVIKDCIGKQPSLRN